jgi:HK97 family phage major capsid protein
MNRDSLILGAEWVRACLDEIEAVHPADAIPADDLARYEAGVTYLDETVKTVKAIDAREAKRAETAEFLASARTNSVTESFSVSTRTAVDPFDTSDLRFNSPASAVRGRVLTALESVKHLDDASRSKATELVERADAPDGRLARHILATGSDSYRSGFQKLVGGAQFALTPQESQAILDARAASLTDASGGYAVPFTLDPTIIDTRTGVTNPFRAIARQVSIVTDSWNGVSSGGVTGSWDGEGIEVSDDTPTLAQPSITVHKRQTFVPFSVEIGGDWASIESDLRMMISNDKDDAEGAAFAVGTGTGQPTGIVTALAGTSSEINVTTAEAFVIADVYAVENALRPRSRSNASWVANKAIYNLVRQFDTSGGAGLWERIGAGMPPELLGYPAHEASAMDGTFDAAATANNYIMVLGDFSDYVIVDRVGLSVELVPHLFSTENNRPNGQRGFYAWWRVGADSVNDGSFVLLDLPTTA